MIGFWIQGKTETLGNRSGKQGKEGKFMPKTFGVGAEIVLERLFLAKRLGDLSELSTCCPVQFSARHSFDGCKSWYGQAFEKSVGIAP